MNKKTNHQHIGFRPITEKDLDFLTRVYADTRAEEMTISGWEQDKIDAFLKMQFDLQHEQWMDNYKGAQFSIILSSNEPVGRLYVQRKENDIRIIDIALFRQFQRQGIVSKIMKDLITEADEKQVTLSLHVEINNPAMGFYEQLGFIKGELFGVYYFMERPANTE